jgi:hypothetical protein
MQKRNYLTLPKDIHLPTKDGWHHYRVNIEEWTLRAICAIEVLELTEEDLSKPEHHEKVAHYCLYYSRFPLRPGGVQLEVETLKEVPECLICHSACPPDEE